MSDPNLLSGITLFLAFCAIGWVAIFFATPVREERVQQTRLFLAAMVIRFAMSLIIYKGGLVNILGDEDSSGWARGLDIYEKWQNQHLAIWELPFAGLAAWEGHHKGYRYLLGAMFYLTDAPYRIPAAALNGFFGALTVVFAYRVSRCLFSPWVAACVGWLTCLLPSMFIWSAQTVKEPVVIFLETAALYGCVRLRQRGLSARHLILCIAAIVCLTPFRFYAGFIVGGAVIAALIGPSLFQGRRAVATLVLVALLSPLVLGKIGGTAPGFNPGTSEFQSFDMNKVQKFRKDVSTGGRKYGSASGVETEDVRTGSGLVKGLAVGAAHLLLAPFPWQLGGGSVRMLLTLPELLVWWWLFFAGVVPGVRYCARHRLVDVGILFLFLLGFGMLYSLMFGNVGLVFRQRAQLLPWLLIFAAVGLERRRLRRNAPRLIEEWPDSFRRKPPALDRGAPRP
jgi:hypothetical protein